MIQDPANRYIATIMLHHDLGGRDVLEIGCGKGRITRDLARYARRVVATDPDRDALAVARATVTASNAEFREAPSGIPPLPDRSFDVVIYTLSLHHVPVAEMTDSLTRAAGLLREDGIIIVLEPGDNGPFTLAKERFGAGSGDERPAREAAIRAMHALKGWTLGDTVHFFTQVQFTDADDFFASMLPGAPGKSDAFADTVREFLALYRTESGIILNAERRLNILRRGAGQ